MTIDLGKVDLILKFTLAAAGREEYTSRELGPIHLVKYVYLADLEYSGTHPGSTYTGAAWRFHHFGPWDPEVFLRIKPVVVEIGARERKISSPKYADDFYFWSVEREEIYDEMSALLPISVTAAVRSAVHAFGNDTAELLHYVYRTRPMLRAAPGEKLLFDTPSIPCTPSRSESEECLTKTTAPLSVSQKKRRREALHQIRETVRAKLAKSLADRKRHTKCTPPRYDDVYFQGLEALDLLAGGPIREEAGVIEVTEEVWKSPFRTEDEIP